MSQSVYRIGTEGLYIHAIERENKILENIKKEKIEYVEEQKIKTILFVVCVARSLLALCLI